MPHLFQRHKPQRIVQGIVIVRKGITSNANPAAQGVFRVERQYLWGKDKDLTEENGE